MKTLRKRTQVTAVTSRLYGHFKRLTSFDGNCYYQYFYKLNKLPLLLLMKTYLSPVQNTGLLHLHKKYIHRFKDTYIVQFSFRHISAEAKISVSSIQNWKRSVKVAGSSSLNSKSLPIQLHTVDKFHKKKNPVSLQCIQHT